MKLVLKLCSTLILVAVTAMTAMTATDARAGEDPSDGILRVGGSTTLLPIISKAASDFMEVFGTWDKADPALPKKRIVVFVSGGGSGFGVKSTINGTVHIGLASRNVKDKEKKILGTHQTFLVGKDAVVIAANKANPLVGAKKNLSFADVSAIFSGEKKTYADIASSLSGDKVVLLVRDSGAGSAEMMQKLIMKKKTVAAGALQLPSQGALLKKMETNKKAIGYISSGLVFGSNDVKAFNLQGVVPTNENVINGSYPFVRPLLMVVKGTPGRMTQRFIDYVMNEGQEIVAANYYVPAGAGKVANNK